APNPQAAIQHRAAVPRAAAQPRPAAPPETNTPWSARSDRSGLRRRSSPKVDCPEPEALEAHKTILTEHPRQKCQGLADRRSSPARFAYRPPPRFHRRPQEYLDDPPRFRSFTLAHRPHRRAHSWQFPRRRGAAHEGWSRRGAPLSGLSAIRYPLSASFLIECPISWISLPSWRRSTRRSEPQ